MNVLRAINGRDNYDRLLVDGYGHLDAWWANSANEEVYPWVFDRLEYTKEQFYYKYQKAAAAAAAAAASPSSNHVKATKQSTVL